MWAAQNLASLISRSKETLYIHYIIDHTLLKKHTMFARLIAVLKWFSSPTRILNITEIHFQSVTDCSDFCNLRWNSFWCSFCKLHHLEIQSGASYIIPRSCKIHYRIYHLWFLHFHAVFSNHDILTSRRLKFKSFNDIHLSALCTRYVRDMALELNQWQGMRS